MKKYLMLTLSSSLALFACNGANTAGDSGSLSSGRNNSDPSKESYRPMDADGLAYFQRKMEMLKKIDPKWAGSFSHSGSNASGPLAKVATTGTVGFLRNFNWGTTGSSDLEVFMDTENDGNADVLTKTNPSVAGNQTQILGVKRLPSTDNGGMLFHFLKTTLTSLPVLKYDYIAVLLSTNCPTNGLQFGEVFDDEDTDNHDWASPSVSPGWSRQDWTGTRLEFCLVPGNNSLSTNIQPPWWGDDQGAFGVAGVNYYSVENGCSSTAQLSSQAIMDGEDDGWAGYFDWEGLSASDTLKVKAIMDNQYGAPSFKITECHVTGG
jgi:hypothetical protein